jgi:hypothetical protein
MTIQTITGPAGTRTVTVGQRYGAPNFNNNMDKFKRQYAWQFGSYHPGGSQYVLGDGAVKFIGDNVEYNGVFTAINRPSDQGSLRGVAGIEEALQDIDGP